jgi:hypothetical protein
MWKSIFVALHESVTFASFSNVQQSVFGKHRDQLEVFHHPAMG